MVFQRNQKHRSGEQQKVGDKIDIRGADDLMRDWLSINLNFFDGAWVQIQLKFLVYRLQHDNKT